MILQLHFEAAIRRLPLAMLLITIVGGCGGTDEFKMVPVTGTVTLDGKALNLAQVKFYPAFGTANSEESRAYTDESGKFKLVGLHGETGAMPGDHNVVITRLVMNDGSPVDPDIDFALVVHEAHESLPATYSSLDQSTLTATVPPGGGEVTFDLKSQP